MVDTHFKETRVHLNSTRASTTAGPFSPCDFENSFPSSICSNALHSIRLQYATVPNQFPNIYGANRVLYFKIQNSATVSTIEFPTGFYTATELVQALNVACAAQFVPLVFSLVTAHDSVIYVNNTSSTNQVELLGSLSIRSQSSSGVHTSMNDVMGVGRDGLVLVPGSGVTRLSNPTALSGPPTVFINCDVLASQNSVHHGSVYHSILGQIPLYDTPYGAVSGISVPESQNYEIFSGFEEHPSSITIRLVDHLNQILELPSNMHPHIVLVARERVS